MRFESYTQRDTPDTTGADVFFQGIDMTRDRPLLQQGMLSLGENTRTRTGHVIQRPGTVQPGDFNPPSGIGPLCGSNVFRNPNGQEVVIVAPSGATYTWVFQNGKDPYKVNYSAAAIAAGNNGTGIVEIVQAFEKVLLLRNPLQGALGPPNTYNLVWDGVPTQTVPGVADSHWEIATLSAEGLVLVPGVWNGEPFMDRIVYYFANALGVLRRDSWYLSDVLDYTSFDDVFQSFRTNPGESDQVTRIMSYFRGSVLVFKDQSIHMATLQPGYPVTMTQRILNSTLGSVGNKMPVMVGGDVIFLSQPNGFYLLSEVIQDQITSLPVPISEPVQRVIEDINWPVTKTWGCSAAFNNYAFFGVSLSSRPAAGCLNAVLVYDTQRKQWESAGDTWRDPAFCFNALHVTNYGGVHRLFAVDYTKGITYLLYEGINDETASGIFSVPFAMQSRGYTGDNPVGFKRFGRAMIGLKTSDPEITVTAVMDGFNEEKVLTPIPITKNNTRFYVHGHKRFDPLTDDPTEQKREDYSVGNDTLFAGNDYDSIPAGNITQVPGTMNDVSVVAPQQESLERLLVRSFGAWCALRIENNSGTCEVSSVAVESTPAMNTGRTAA